MTFPRMKTCFPLLFAALLFPALAFADAEPSAAAVAPVTEASSSGAQPAMPATLAFGEIWAYLMDGEERSLSPSYPLTDIGYFGAGISTYGKLVGVPNRAKLKDFGGRVHLVVAETGNSALTHFCLDPDYPLRDALIADIVAASEKFDGVQLDFEAVPAKDLGNFRGFLAQLKAGIGAKTLSVALPAIVSEKQERFDYAAVAAIVDRVVVMAYDEHWSGSVPGPVASIDWGRRVALYALSKIGAQKLVMGAPFYGRSWADKSLARAYKYSGLAGIVEEKQLGAVQRKDGIPFVEYVETVSVKAYFEDAISAATRLAMYREAAVDKVAFWRLGQEDPAVWSCMAVAAPAEQGRPAPEGQSEAL